MKLSTREIGPVLLLALAVLVFDYLYLIRGQSPFCWDEAHHSTYSLLIARSLAAGDLGAFWQHTHSQVYWPFLHSWAAAPFLLAGGYNFEAARFANAFFGSVSVWLLYLLARRAAGKTAALIAVILLVLSPMYHVFSSTAMLENLGMTLTLSLLLLLFRSWERGGWGNPFTAGAVLAALYLTKDIYGVFFGAGLAVFYLTLLPWPEEGAARGRIFRGLPWLAAGFILVWGSWVIFPPSALKLGMFFNYRMGDTGSWNPFGYTPSENRLFFIRALYYAYGFSIATYLLYLGGIVFGFARFRDLRMRLLLLIFLVNFIPMSAIVNSQERFIYLGFAPLLVLVGAGTVWAWRRLGNAGRWAPVAVLALLAAGDLHKLPRIYKQLANASLSANLYRDEVRFDWSTLFGLAAAPRWLRYPKQYFNPDAPSRMPDDTLAVVRYVQTATDPRWPLCAPAPLGTLSPHLWHWEYLLTGRPVATQWNPNCVYFLLVEVAETSPYNRLGNRHLVGGTRTWAEFLRRLEAAGLVREAGSRDFPGTGLTGRIFVRNAPPEHPGWRSCGSPF